MHVEMYQKKMYNFQWPGRRNSNVLENINTKKS